MIPANQVPTGDEPISEFLDWTARRQRYLRHSANVFYLSPYWVQVVSLSPQSRIVRYRRVHEQVIRRMGRLAFLKQARAA